MSSESGDQPGHPLGVVREQWEKSKLRPLVLGAAGLVAVGLGLMIATNIVPTLSPLPPDCAVTTRVEQVDKLGTMDDEVSTVTETVCSNRAVPAATLWVGLAFLGVLVLPEIATALPGSNLPIPGGGEVNTPGITYAPQRKAEQIAEDLTPAFLHPRPWWRRVARPKVPRRRGGS